MSSEQGIILASCLSPMRRNSVLKELRVKRLAFIHSMKRSVAERSEGE